MNTGEVIAGDASRGQAFVTGDAVNVAARLEQAAGIGEILIGEHTLELVRDAVQVEPVPPLDLKGKSEPVPAFRLIDVAEPGGGGGAGRRAHRWSGASASWLCSGRPSTRTVAERSCELVTVLGPAGIGKSRLAQDFADTLRGAATVVAGRCLSYGEGLTFWPLREVVEGLAGIDDGESSEEAQAASRALLPADDDTAIARGARGRGARAVGRRRARRRRPSGPCGSSSRRPPPGSRSWSSSRTSTGASRPSSS